MGLEETYFLEMADYERIMSQESKFALNTWYPPTSEEMIRTSILMSEYAKNSKVLRIYNNQYGLTKAKIAYESVAAHTNLVSEIITRALSYVYGPDVDELPRGIIFKDILDAVRRHDLPENMTGDTADNGARDEQLKLNAENVYQQYISSLMPPREYDRNCKVVELINEMNNKSTEIGRMIYLADKASAIIATLRGFEDGDPPLLSPKSPYASAKDKRIMTKCDLTVKGKYYASEMWTNDWFGERRLVDYDDSGYFTALIVMSTLRVRQRWYSWRENVYEYE